MWSVGDNHIQTEASDQLTCSATFWAPGCYEIRHEVKTSSGTLPKNGEVRSGTRGQTRGSGLRENRDRGEAESIS